MHLSLASAATLFSYYICLSCHHLIIVWASSAPAPDFLGDVAIDCGSFSNSAGFDGRQWIAEAQVLEPKGKSTSSRIARDRPFSDDPIPYMTARISAAQFSYTFQVNPGQKFIRFHFHPSSYIGFEKSYDFFSVKVGHFTVLKNFSASLAAHALGVIHLVKEFCLNVEENEKLHIIFSPYQSSKLRKTYAFVNGIEIISMRTGLYYTPDENIGAPIVGQRNRFYWIDNSTALEMVQRLNIGGGLIEPIEDFGMFRSWSADVNYLLTSKLQPMNYLVRGIKFTSIPAFTAPLKIYQTSWKTGERGRADKKMHDFTWKIQVDGGFAYLVRLHFCDFEPEMTEGGQRKFTVAINDQVAETKVDIFSLSGGIGVPIYRDYVVMVKGKKEAGKGDLFIALQSPNELVIGLLHGLEIFKLSGLGDNLASSNTSSLEQVSTLRNTKIQNFPSAFGQKNAVMTFMTVLCILVNTIVFKLRQIWEQINREDKATQPAFSGQSFRCFKLQEIISATHNFSYEFHLGKGGFGEVYKGFICDSSEIVAVKRLKPNSKQGAQEFWAEIEALSKIRHIHLVSLLGYCNEHQEMILVYEYMPRGTLADNLYKIGRNGRDGNPLTWEQRLRICIGSARGLDYLHTGIEHGVIHRDVKDSNILLDENLVAKISDFGLSKLGRLSESQSYISTKVKGTFGYLDPEYIMTHKATRKTDVYAFGVVMLVVLSGRRAVDTRIPGEPQSLVSLFRECLAKGDLDDIIDPNLAGNFSLESLKEFIKSIEHCIQPIPKKRPTMSQVVTSLEYALELEKQQSTNRESTKSEAAAMSADCSRPCDHDGIINELRVSPLHQENGISSPEEGMAGKMIESPESPTRQADLESIRKPVWFWRWGAALKKKRKNSRKYFPSEYKLISHFRVSEMKQDLPIEDGLGAISEVQEDSPSETGLISSFTISEIEEATNNFSNGRLIKENQSGRMFEGYLRRLHKQCTIYQFKGKVSNEMFTEFINELKKLLQLRHPNIVSIMGYCYHESQVFAVYEYITSITLHHFLYDASRAPLSWIDRIRICVGVAKGLQFLHNGTEKTRIHGHLKPDNILIQECWPKGRTPLILWNFDLFRLNNQEIFMGVTEGYRPQEFLSHALREKYDVYSFGFVLLEVLCRQNLFIDPESVKYKVGFHMMSLKIRVEMCIKTRRLDLIIDSNLEGQIEHECLYEFLKIALSCLRYDPRERPTMEYIVEKLELSLHLQENAEAGKHKDLKGKTVNDFNLENMYQLLSMFLAEEQRMKC